MQTKNLNNLYFIILIVDSTPPSVFDCPQDVTTTTELGTEGTPVFWNKPFVTDISGILQITSSHSPGQIFSTGSTFVKYFFQDGSFNVAECNFTVTVETGKTKFEYKLDSIIVPAQPSYPACRSHRKLTLTP